MINHSIIYIYSFLIVFFLLYAPFIGVYFRLLNTLNHEIGHAVTSLLTGGGVQDIGLYKNTSGVARTSSRRWTTRTTTVFAGYPFASAVAALSAYGLTSLNAKTIICLFLIMVLVGCLLWVQNIFGLMWGMVFMMLSYLVYYHGTSTIHFFYALTLVEILLIESLMSAFTIFLLSFRNKENAGDALQLSKLTKIPTIVWGSLFLIQALFFTVTGFYLLLRF